MATPIRALTCTSILSRSPISIGQIMPSRSICSLPVRMSCSSVPRVNAAAKTIAGQTISQTSSLTNIGGSGSRTYSSSGKHASAKWAAITCMAISSAFFGAAIMASQINLGEEEAPSPLQKSAIVAGSWIEMLSVIRKVASGSIEFHVELLEELEVEEFAIKVSNDIVEDLLAVLLQMDSTQAATLKSAIHKEIKSMLDGKARHLLSEVLFVEMNNRITAVIERFILSGSAKLKG